MPLNALTSAAMLATHGRLELLSQIAIHQQAEVFLASSEQQRLSTSLVFVPIVIQINTLIVDSLFPISFPFRGLQLAPFCLRGFLMS